jgi:ABC-type sugar transport system permease subunit
MKKNNLAGLMFVAPLVLLFLVMNVYPIIYNLVISGTDWNGIAKSWNFIGLQNYGKLMSNPVMPRVLRNFAGFGNRHHPDTGRAGVLLPRSSRGREGAGLYRTVFYCRSIATATSWATLFKDSGTNRDTERDVPPVGLNALASLAGEPNLALLWII